jgi:radical SAM protein with 4Fe4S-binding SPASM domain
MQATSTSQPYFGLGSSCVLVRGACRAALHDLASGDIYSIDPVGRTLIEGCQAGRPVAEVVAEIAAKYPEAGTDKPVDYLHQLAAAGLGSFVASPETASETTFPPAPRRLDFLWLELREDCNLRCRHCYCTSDCRRRVADRLTHDEWIGVMKDAVAVGCSKVQFIGGEPLLYGPRIFDLAREARRLGYEHIEVFSNLTLLKDEWIDELVALKMKVACSIFSRRPEVHDLVTTVPGAFERTMDSVRRLKARGIQPRFAVTVMKHNQEYVDETMEFLRELGDPKPDFDLVRPAGRGNDDELLPDKYKQARAYQTRPMFRQTTHEEFVKRYTGNSCWQGKAVVASGGDVHPCIMQRDSPAGNVRKEGLASILENGIRRYWDLSYDKIETCRDCEYRYACKDCRPVTFGPTGDLKAKSIYCTYDPYLGQWPCEAGAGE